MARAVELSYRALAVTDHNGFYGAVRFSTAARDAGLPAVYGTEIGLSRNWKPPAVLRKEPTHASTWNPPARTQQADAWTEADQQGADRSFVAARRFTCRLPRPLTLCHQCSVPRRERSADLCVERSGRSGQGRRISSVFSGCRQGVSGEAARPGRPGGNDERRPSRSVRFLAIASTSRCGITACPKTIPATISSGRLAGPSQPRDGRNQQRPLSPP